MNVNYRARVDDAESDLPGSARDALNRLHSVSVVITLAGGYLLKWQLLSGLCVYLLSEWMNVKCHARGGDAVSGSLGLPLNIKRARLPDALYRIYSVSVVIRHVDDIYSSDIVFKRFACN